MSLAITVADITVRERVVVLPDDCPKCRRPLRHAALTAWEFQDQSRPAAVLADGTVDFDPADIQVPAGGETFISYVTLVCECGAFLVDGKFDVVRECAEGPDQRA